MAGQLANVFNPGGLQLQIPGIAPQNPNPPPREKPIQVMFEDEPLPGLIAFIERGPDGRFVFNGDYTLNGVRQVAQRGLVDVVKTEIAKEYVVPPGTVIQREDLDENRALYVSDHPLKKKDAMEVEGGRKRRRTRKTKRRGRRSRKTHRYRKG